MLSSLIDEKSKFEKIGMVTFIDIFENLDLLLQDNDDDIGSDLNFIDLLYCLELLV